MLLNALPPLAITTRKLSVRMGPLAEMRNERIHTQAQMGGIAVGCIAARILMTTNIYIYIYNSLRGATPNPTFWSIHEVALSNLA